MSDFYRIFNPRAVKAVKAISLLANGIRYAPTQEEKDHTLEVLKDAVNDIAKIYGMLSSEDTVVEDIDTTCIAPDIAMDNAQRKGLEATSEERIKAKKALIERSAFARQDVHMNVLNIPSDQLTAYATQIVARLCSRFEEPEAQPKNYVAKEE